MANSVTHAALPYPIKNARFSILATMLSSAGVATDPTSPAGTFNLDSGGDTSLGNAPTVYGSGKGLVLQTLTGAETNGSAVGVQYTGTGVIATNLCVYPRNLPILASGTLSAGSAGGGTLQVSGIQNYDITGCFIRTTGGTGGGGTGGANNQARRITSYTVSTGAFTVSPSWEVTVSTDTTYDILVPEGVTLSMLKRVPEKPYWIGVLPAQSGPAGTITLPANTTATQVYPGGRGVFLSGAGAGGEGIITNNPTPTGMGTATPVVYVLNGAFPGGNPGAGTVMLFQPSDGVVPLVALVNATGLPKVAQSAINDTSIVGTGTSVDKFRAAGQDPVNPAT